MSKRRYKVDLSTVKINRTQSYEIEEVVTIEVAARYSNGLQNRTKMVDLSVAIELRLSFMRCLVVVTTSSLLFPLQLLSCLGSSLVSAVQG